MLPIRLNFSPIPLVASSLLVTSIAIFNTGFSNTPRDPIERVEYALSIPCMLMFEKTNQGSTLRDHRVFFYPPPKEIRGLEVASIQRLTNEIPSEFDVDWRWEEIENQILYDLSYSYDQPQENLKSLGLLTGEIAKMIKFVKVPQQLEAIDFDSAFKPRWINAINPTQIVSKSLEIAFLLLAEYYERADTSELPRIDYGQKKSLNLRRSSNWLVTYYTKGKTTLKHIESLKGNLRRIEAWILYVAEELASQHGRWSQIPEMRQHEPSPFAKVVYRMRDAIFMWHARTSMEHFAGVDLQNIEKSPQALNQKKISKLTSEEFVFLSTVFLENFESARSNAKQEIVYVDTALSLLWQARLVDGLLSEARHWSEFSRIWNKTWLRIHILVTKSTVPLTKHLKRRLQRKRRSMLGLWQSTIKPAWQNIKLDDLEFQTFLTDVEHDIRFVDP